jgi:hypothetical protein
MKVSAVVLTFNEEINIERCLRSIQRCCDDIVVIDSGSKDATIAICEQMGARVLHNPWVNFSTQRNFALEHGALKQEWILHLDADEELTPEFIATLEALQPEEGIWGYRVPWRTMLFGKWLRRSGMYPIYQVRIGHRERCTFHEHGHGQRENLTPEQVGTFPVPYDHHNFSHGLYPWLVKHVGYARAEAEQIFRTQSAVQHMPVERESIFANAMARRRAMKRAADRLPPLLRPFAKFFYMAVLRGGVLDGPTGLYYCVMMSIYETMIALMLIEKRKALQGQRP